MAIDRFDVEWAELGEVEADTTFDEKASTGYVDERVPYPRLNKGFNRLDAKVNQMLDWGPKRGMKTAGHAHLLSQRWPGGTSPYDAVPAITGTVSQYFDSALAYIDDSPVIIATDSGNTLNVDIFDLVAETCSSQAIPAASLPSPDGGELWYAYAVVCDADTAYILFTQLNSGAASTYQDYQIQAYNLSDWAVKTGWPSTGLVVFNSTTSEIPDVIDATDTLIAVANPGLTISSSASPAVSFVNKATGTMTSQGAGDQTSGTSASRICSNGTYVFTAKGYSITIASPTTGCGGTNWPRAVTGEDVACIGGLVVITTGSSTDLAYVLHTSQARIATLTTPDVSICKDLARITTDGLYFWATGTKTIGGTVNRVELFKIDPYRFLNKDGTTAESYPVWADIVIQAVPFWTGVGTAADRDTPPPVYDGESVWIIPSTGTANLFRVPRINLR